MTFSEKVQEVRGQLKLTQAQLAKELGVAFSTINRWEKGRNEPQSFIMEAKFEKFCEDNNIAFCEDKD